MYVADTENQRIRKVAGLTTDDSSPTIPPTPAPSNEILCSECVNPDHVYVKISKVYTTGVGTLNLQEIDLYNNGQLIDGSKLTFTQCSTNSQYYSYFNAENCNNDQLGSNWMSLCHTYEDTDSTWILVDAGSESFDQIVVTNRQDCCQDRIDGATISVYYGSEELLWSAEFNDLGTSLYSYDFTVTDVPTAVPTNAIPSSLVYNPTYVPTLAPSTNVISTIAGNGVYGSSSGDGDDALSATVNPWGVTLDSSGSKAYYFPFSPC